MRFAPMENEKPTTDKKMKLGGFDYLTKPFEPDEGSSPQIPPATCRRLVYPGREAWGHLPHGDPGRSV